jgi:hypothetical protein
MSKPIVVTACMDSCSESWEHKSAHIHGTHVPGGGAIHSIVSDKPPKSNRASASRRSILPEGQLRCAPIKRSSSAGRHDLPPSSRVRLSSSVARAKSKDHHSGIELVLCRLKQSKASSAGIVAFYATLTFAASGLPSSSAVSRHSSTCPSAERRSAEFEIDISGSSPAAVMAAASSVASREYLVAVLAAGALPSGAVAAVGTGCCTLAVAAGLIALAASNSVSLPTTSSTLEMSLIVLSTASRAWYSCVVASRSSIFCLAVCKWATRSGISVTSAMGFSMARNARYSGTFVSRCFHLVPNRLKRLDYWYDCL